jgi:chorismate-pyruvate lyase
MDTRAPTPYLKALAALFYPQLGELGEFERAEPPEMPPLYRSLLDHQNHMTVTVEQHHGSSVDVRVIQTSISGHHYARKILLARQSDGRVVQFGIMRLDFNCVNAEVRQQVESQQIPLGRILIEHDILRVIHLRRLWKVTPGPDLQKLFGISSPLTTYGRTAAIDFDGAPAVDLLEIVAPEMGDEQ